MGDKVEKNEKLLSSDPGKHSCYLKLFISGSSEHGEG